jgi:hypothetical protein
MQVDNAHPALQREHDQLISFWSKLFGDGRGRFKSDSAPFRRLLARENSSSNDIRKVHDKFGWGAKEPIKCAGTIYRTCAFMSIEPEQRDSRKPRGIPHKESQRNIHIEHTVLASQLHKMWMACSDLELTFFISHGITTAMSACEEKKVGAGGKPNHCFTGDYGKPFARYKDTLKDSEIWNVLTGQRVYIDKYTLADHRTTVTKLLECAKAPESSIFAVKRSNYSLHLY